METTSGSRSSRCTSACVSFSAQSLASRDSRELRVRRCYCHRGLGRGGVSRSGATLAWSEPLTALPRSARSRVSSTRSLCKRLRGHTTSPIWIMQVHGHSRLKRASENLAALAVCSCELAEADALTCRAPASRHTSSRGREELTFGLSASRALRARAVTEL